MSVFDIGLKIEKENTQGVPREIALQFLGILDAKKTIDLNENLKITGYELNAKPGTAQVKLHVEAINLKETITAIVTSAAPPTQPDKSNTKTKSLTE